MVTTPIQPYVMAEQLEGRRFLIRAVAYIIDTAIILLMDYVFSFLIFIIVGIFYISIYGRTPEIVANRTWMDYLIGILMTLGYFLIYESISGATPAKLILGMRVIMKTGDSCTFKAALIRGLLRFVDGLFFGIPAYMRMKSPAYCRIGDDAANTLVVSSRSPLIRQTRPWWSFLIATLVALIFLGIMIIILDLPMIQ